MSVSVRTFGLSPLFCGLFWLLWNPDVILPSLSAALGSLALVLVFLGNWQDWRWPPPEFIDADWFPPAAELKELQKAHEAHVRRRGYLSYLLRSFAPGSLQSKIQAAQKLLTRVLLVVDYFKARFGRAGMSWIGLCTGFLLLHAAWRFVQVKEFHGVFIQIVLSPVLVFVGVKLSLLGRCLGALSRAVCPRRRLECGRLIETDGVAHLDDGSAARLTSFYARGKKALSPRHGHDFQEVFQMSPTRCQECGSLRSFTRVHCCQHCSRIVCGCCARACVTGCPSHPTGQLLNHVLEGRGSH